MDYWGWRRLLQLGAGLAFVLLAAGNLLFGPDPIFLSFAALMLAGVVLTRWRTRIGAIVILVPSLAALAFAAPSGFFVATHPIAFWDLSSALFALLPLIAVVNILALLGILLGGKLGALRQPVIPRVVGGIAIVVVVFVAGLGAVARAGVTSVNASGGDLRLDAKEIKFSKTSLESPSNVSIFVSNSDSTFHTFTIDGVVNEQMPANSNHRIALTLKPGEYRYSCAVPGHADTMHGTLRIH